ncbi:putative nucleic acid-binding protein [Lupinus albus]|uniref:Putative nucleic acid-binding protein n=1 Tax=Lupinus albus TaxID=3870 RepID=A0A6A4PHY4_LUPAL|nr:putative nucleic acid-binding protein [Lupinus albus]
MARRVNFIEEINATKDTWKIKVRIIGLWRVERSSAPSLEMIFMDENGDKIEAMVKNYHISLWEPQLQEGQSYVGDNFDVVSNE